jgi:hypothetical protein
MKRGAYLGEIRLSPVARAQFTLTGFWKNKDGTIGQHAKTFTKDMVFSYAGTQGFRLKKKQCRHSDDFIREVLRVRGVIT